MERGAGAQECTGKTARTAVRPKGPQPPGNWVQYSRGTRPILPALQRRMALPKVAR